MTACALLPCCLVLPAQKDFRGHRHGPIPSLKWGEMTMPFKLPASGLPGSIAVGDTVAFEIRQTKDGMFEITSIEPLSSASGSSAKGNDQTGARK
jgi:hypothetical protein